MLPSEPVVGYDAPPHAIIRFLQRNVSWLPDGDSHISLNLYADGGAKSESCCGAQPVALLSAVFDMIFVTAVLFFI